MGAKNHTVRAKAPRNKHTKQKETMKQNDDEKNTIHGCRTINHGMKGNLKRKKGRKFIDL